MKQILFLVVVPLLMVVLAQCATAPQMWPANERRTEDRMFALQQRIGNGLASGEITPREAQNLLAELEDIRSVYGFEGKKNPAGGMESSAWETGRSGEGDYQGTCLSFKNR